MVSLTLPDKLLLASYVVAFASAAIICFACMWQAYRIESPDVRRGMVALLSASTAWAVFTLAYLVWPFLGMSGQEWLYDLGLVFGFATVFSWLYFCFALAGRGLHRNPRARFVSLGIFGIVAVTKLTNPLHGLYFTSTAVVEPFPHLAIDHHSLFWISLGLSYTLAAIGYFTLYEFLSRVRDSTTSLKVLLGLMVLPALLNIVGYASPLLLDISYEPLGVAAFAIGTFIFYQGFHQDRFQEVRLVGSHGGPALAVGRDGHIRSYNKAAADALPSLNGTGGTEANGRYSLQETVPELSAALENGEVVTTENGTRRRYYRVNASPLGSGEVDSGTFVQLTDVTDRQRRWRLEEARREGVAESIPGVEFQYYADSKRRPAYRFVGERAEEVLGISPDLEGFEERFLDRVPEEYHDRYRRCSEGIVEEGQTNRAELPFNRPDGTQIWLLLASQVDHHQVPGEGKELLFNGVMLDITERKRARAQADLQASVLRRVAEGEPLEETLNGLVEGLEALCPGMIGSVLLCNSREETLRHGAAPSLPEDYVRAIEGLPTGPDGGSLGTAAYSGEMIVAADIKTDPRWKGYRELALRHNLRASWWMPIKDSEGEVLGTFAMYYRTPRRPSKTDWALIEKAQSLARVAIERHRNTDRLRLLSESLAQSTEAALITGGKELDPPGGPEIIYANAAFEEMTGYDLEEIQGKTPRVLQGPETDRDTLDSLRASLEAGKPWEGETINYRKDGTFYRVRWKTAPVTGEDGEIQYWVALQRDVTERRQKEQALRKREAQLRSITENVSDAIYRSTEEDGIVYANQAFLDLFGYESLEELDDVAPQTFYASPEIRSELLPEENGETLAGEEVTFQRKDGTTFVGLLSTRRIDGEEGRTYYDGVITDITQRKRREQKLVEAKEEAEEAAHLKAAMMANMSHETRTPLTSIIGFTEVLSEELEGQMQVFAQKAYRSGQRLMKTLDSVLEFSRLEAGDLDFGREEIDLRHLVEEAHELIGLAAEEKSLALDTEIPTTAATTHGNETALRRILENLLENAVKFTPEGGRVVVRARSESDRVALEVEDTGIGMNPGEVDRLFEAFKQESEGLTRRYEGSGLGLSIVRQIVEALGGTIDVDTRKGEGSRFTVWFPREDAPTKSDR